MVLSYYKLTSLLFTGFLPLCCSTILLLISRWLSPISLLGMTYFLISSHLHAYCTPPHPSLHSMDDIVSCCIEERGQELWNSPCPISPAPPEFPAFPLIFSFLLLEDRLVILPPVQC